MSRRKNVGEFGQRAEKKKQLNAGSTWAGMPEMADIA